MKSIVIYTDGSQFAHINDQIGFSWGVVALHDDAYVEMSGHRFTHRENANFHEILGFIEGLLYARSHGYQLNEMSFYTDDETLAYASFRLHPDNRTKCMDDLRARLMRACSLFYDESLFDDLIEALNVCRITKVKGHSTCIYNCRVDYLAECARFDVLGKKKIVKS